MMSLNMTTKSQNITFCHSKCYILSLKILHFVTQSLPQTINSRRKTIAYLVLLIVRNNEFALGTNLNEST